jgi:hypothetical protein
VGWPSFRGGSGMRISARGIFAIVMFYAATAVARADAFSINLESGGTSPIVGPCDGGQCLHGFVSQLFTFHAGDTVDMGSVLLSGFTFDMQGTESSFRPEYLISLGPISSLSVPIPQIFASCNFGTSCIDQLSCRF